MRVDRVVLALEVLFGVLPITIGGGVDSFFGLLFGSVSVVMALRAFAFRALALWLGILGLAACGLCGILGLWAVVALSAGFRPHSLALRKVALVGSIAGILAAGVCLVFLFTSPTVERRPFFVYIVVAPVLVVLHRGLALRRSSRTGAVGQI